MTVLELVQEEIRRNFPSPLRSNISNDEYKLECSQAMYDGLLKSFMKVGLQIPASIDGKEVDISTVKFTRLQIPILGILNVHTTLDQGYKIEKL